MEEYERACCIQGYHIYKVMTALLTKAFVHDSLLHHHHIEDHLLA